MLALSPAPALASPLCSLPVGPLLVRDLDVSLPLCTCTRAHTTLLVCKREQTLLVCSGGWEGQWGQQLSLPGTVAHHSGCLGHSGAALMTSCTEQTKVTVEGGEGRSQHTGAGGNCCPAQDDKQDRATGLCSLRPVAHGGDWSFLVPGCLGPVPEEALMSHGDEPSVTRGWACWWPGPALSLVLMGSHHAGQHSRTRGGWAT